MRNTATSSSHRARQQEMIEARLALRLAGALGEASQQLPHDVTERLRVARERALERAVAARRASAAAASATVVAQSGGTAVFGWMPPVWLRLASLMPLAVLLVGLVMIQQYHDQEQIAVAAEIDAALLKDELPPTAYGDPGFAEYLRSNPRP